MVILSDYQLKTIRKLKTGSILYGGVGSGKSRTSIGYYIKQCGGSFPINERGKYIEMKTPKNLYIITTAKKRDSGDWYEELAPFCLTLEDNFYNVNVTIDSWNNIKKYKNVKNSFFIFDEQRVVGWGSWSKNFVKIAKNNDWILLTATPGDVWLDYAPVFIANGFYKNITEFRREHVVYDSYVNFPRVKFYIKTKKLESYKREILVVMRNKKKTKRHDIYIYSDFDMEGLKTIQKERWNIFDNKPIYNASEYLITCRKFLSVSNDKILKFLDIIKKHDKIIVFYNYIFELEIIKNSLDKENINYKEWNGQKHEDIPKTNKWVYLVQYTAGAEGWNCVETNIILFYSLNYSYKIMEQAKGRIDRMNTKYLDLYYYMLVTNSYTDKHIRHIINTKQEFNLSNFYKGNNNEKKNTIS